MVAIMGFITQCLLRNTGVPPVIFKFSSDHNNIVTNCTPSVKSTTQYHKNILQIRGFLKVRLPSLRKKGNFYLFLFGAKQYFLL